MTIILPGIATAAVTTGVASAAVVGTTTGLVFTLAGRLLARESASNAAGAVGASISAGAILGSTFGEGVDSAVTGAVAGGIAGGASQKVAVSVPAITSGPIGWLLLGVAHDSSAEKCTFDCWKPILHEQSPIPSTGKFLRDVVTDARIKEVISTTNADSPFPEITLRNIWNELYRIEYVILPSKQLAAHAVRLE